MITIIALFSRRADKLLYEIYTSASASESEKKKARVPNANTGLKVWGCVFRLAAPLLMANAIAVADHTPANSMQLKCIKGIKKMKIICTGRDG